MCTTPSNVVSYHRQIAPLLQPNLHWALHPNSSLWRQCTYPAQTLVLCCQDHLSVVWAAFCRLRRTLVSADQLSALVLMAAGAPNSASESCIAPPVSLRDLSQSRSLAWSTVRRMHWDSRSSDSTSTAKHPRIPIYSVVDPRRRHFSACSVPAHERVIVNNLMNNTQTFCYNAEGMSCVPPLLWVGDPS